MQFKNINLGKKNKIETILYWKNGDFHMLQIFNGLHFIALINQFLSANNRFVVM